MRLRPKCDARAKRASNLRKTVPVLLAATILAGCGPFMDVVKLDEAQRPKLREQVRYYEGGGSRSRGSPTYPSDIMQAPPWGPAREPGGRDRSASLQGCGVGGEWHHKSQVRQPRRYEFGEELLVRVHMPGRRDQGAVSVTPLTDLEEFVTDHRPHGTLTGDATEPAWNGYLLTSAATAYASDDPLE